MRTATSKLSEVDSSAWLLAFVFVVGFISAQRFTFPYLSAYVCLVPLGFALLVWQRVGVRNLLIIVSLFAKVDLGDVAYMETLNVIRFVIYILAFLLLVGRVRVGASIVLLLLAYLTIIGSSTLINSDDIDLYTFVRDSTQKHNPLPVKHQ